jgi:hypothetical protein
MARDVVVREAHDFPLSTALLHVDGELCAVRRAKDFIGEIVISNDSLDAVELLARDALSGITVTVLRSVTPVAFLKPQASSETPDPFKVREG